MASDYQIVVSVETQYIPEQSDASEKRYVFSYSITISNIGKRPAQLISRHWIITDSNEKIEEVRGQGVVGEQPYLQPGSAFHYTSGTVLETPFGTMRGSYQMVGEDGTTFDAPIEEFVFTGPRTLH